MGQCRAAAEESRGALMFLVVSKVLWLIVQPTSIALLLVLIALVLGFTRFRKSAQLSLVLAALVLGLSAFTSLGYVLIDPLENTFSRPATPPAEVAGIIVLGGGMDTDVNTVRGGYEFNRSGDRFLEALRLAAAYPAARIVISGGGSVLTPDDEREAIAGARLFAAFGIPAERLVLEDASRNTEENALLTRDSLRPQPGETWLLVTSAFHMPRSVGLFRRAGFTIVPWPADYLSSGQEPFEVRISQPAENVSVTTMALREWTGLLVYWLTGRIDQLVPQP
jgi:uncharacterized SAM-binding protein YcdF (DUF218 family)